MTGLADASQIASRAIVARPTARNGQEGYRRREEGESAARGVFVSIPEGSRAQSTCGAKAGRGRQRPLFRNRIWQGGEKSSQSKNSRGGRQPVDRFAARRRLASAHRAAGA